MGLLKRYLSFLPKVWFRLLRNGYSRADYLRKHHVLRSIGDNVYFYSRIFPADGKLLRLGSNVVIATNVRFLGHDRIDIMLSGMFETKYSKFYDCIDIGNNVFIGSDVIILPGVQIGDCTVIGAGAIVTKDLPPGGIWGGIPAKRIGNFDDFIAKRKDLVHPESDPDKLWHAFEQRHK